MSLRQQVRSTYSRSTLGRLRQDITGIEEEMAFGHYVVLSSWVVVDLRKLGV